MFAKLYKNNMRKEEEENLLEATEILSKSALKDFQLRPSLLILSVSLNILLTFLGAFIIAHKTDFCTKPSYEHGFATDLEPALSQVQLIVKTFSGGVELDTDGRFFTDQGGHEYVGTPEPAVDKAWSLLLGGLNLDFDQSRVDLAESTFQWPESGFYFSGLDVFHSLHCLNRLRQAMYPDYYNHTFDWPADPSRVSHIDHCINHIRQSLQCHADLTPMEWRQVGSKLILKTDTRHTCRDFDKIHSWAISQRTQYGSIESILNGSLHIVD